MKFEKYVKTAEEFTIPLVVFTLVYFFVRVVFGQEAVPAIPVEQAPAVVPAWQATIGSLIEKLESPWVISAAVIFIEFLMRFVKTSDPKSLLYVIANGLKIFAKLFEKLAAVLDKYLQRVK
jgi:hypothetical protein